MFSLKKLTLSSKDGESPNSPTTPTPNAMTKRTAQGSSPGGPNNSVNTLWRKITGGGTAPPLSSIANRGKGGQLADRAPDGAMKNGDKKEEVYDGAHGDIDGAPPKKSTLDGDENSGKGGEVIRNGLHDMEDNGGKKEEVSNEDVDNDRDKVGDKVVENDEDEIDDDGKCAGDNTVTCGRGSRRGKGRGGRGGMCWRE